MPPGHVAQVPGDSRAAVRQSVTTYLSAPCLMILDPLDQLFSEKYSLLPYLVRRKPLAHEVVYRLVTYAQELLRLLERQMDTLDLLDLFSHQGRRPG